MIDDTVSVFLKEAGVSLRDVSRDNMLHEMEFNMPITNIKPSDFASIMERGSGYQKDVIAIMNNLSGDTIRGFLKGFIDLIFRVDNRYYVLDWKSNHLGSNLEGYNQENCNSAALHRYLEKNLNGYTYEKNFGGVYYLFLRGLRKDASSGIYFHKPDQIVIESFSDYCYRGSL
jgi:exodeoxyribonuclease V beta subunit